MEAWREREIPLGELKISCLMEPWRGERFRRPKRAGFSGEQGMEGAEPPELRKNIIALTIKIMYNKKNEHVIMYFELFDYALAKEDSEPELIEKNMAAFKVLNS